MQIIFTKHAKEQMLKRGITESDVQKCIKFPDYVDYNENQIVIFKSLKTPYVYVVIASQNKDSIRVITIYKSSKITKYLNSQ